MPALKSEIGSKKSHITKLGEEVSNLSIPYPWLREDQSSGIIQNTQVYKRSKEKGLEPELINSLILNYQNQANKKLEISDNLQKKYIFNGSKLSELKELLGNNRSIYINSENLIVDETLTIKAKNLKIDCSPRNKIFTEKSFQKLDYREKYYDKFPVVTDIKYAFDLVDSKDIQISGCEFSNIQAIAIRDSQNIKVEKLSIIDSPGYGIILGPGNKNIKIEYSIFRNNYGSGIVVMEDNLNTVINNNHISGGTGSSNFHAGILVTDRKSTDMDIFGVNDFLLNRNGHWYVPREIIKRSSPKFTYIFNNKIESNLSSGIYLDGAYLTMLAYNHLSNNSKEGICVDNGSTLNLIYSNTVNFNGDRWGKSDFILKKDFAFDDGRMKDGTPKRKVPGISIDNAIYNFILSNIISNNYGSGIKMVRTSFYNVIGKNSISKNNLGKNDIHKFFGIEVGGALADTPLIELDFSTSMSNVIYSNSITGNHYAGIFFCEGCNHNDVFDNIITHSDLWGIEQVSKSNINYFLNNFSTNKSRNASLNGTLGRTLIGGELQFDN